jgi:hypothetical protein
MDNWANLASKSCSTCMYYNNFRCRRHAPNVVEPGYPAVFPTDYCGDHKIGKETMALLSAEPTVRSKGR